MNGVIAFGEFVAAVAMFAYWARRTRQFSWVISLGGGFVVGCLWLVGSTFFMGEGDDFPTIFGLILLITLGGLLLFLGRSIQSERIDAGTDSDDDDEDEDDHVLDNGDCLYCRQPKGPHPDCISKAKAARAQMIDVAMSQLRSGSDLNAAKVELERIASEAGTNIAPAVREAWAKFAEESLAEGVVSEVDEKKINAYKDFFAIESHWVSASLRLRLEKSVILRTVADGLLPVVENASALPFNFQKSEQLVYVFGEVNYFKEKTYRRYEGASDGLNIRIAKGIHYKVNAYKGRPVDETKIEKVDRGLLAATTKHLYFQGRSEGFRVNYEKIIAFQPYSDGVGIQRDAKDARPELFELEDGAFAFALLSLVSRTELT